MVFVTAEIGTNHMGSLDLAKKLIDVAKSKVFDPNKSVSEIAYELGFKYPQHFSRLFKKQVGHSPKEFRHLN